MIIEAKLVDYNHIRYLEDGEWIDWYGSNKASKPNRSYKGPIIFSLARHLIDKGYRLDDYLDVTGPGTAKTISGCLEGLATLTIYQPDDKPMRRTRYEPYREGAG